jgi:uncharacterized protein (UPF0332 family)
MAPQILERLSRRYERKPRRPSPTRRCFWSTRSPEATINRGYYSVFQAARAALLTEGESPDTHSGVIRRFGYHFVRTGKVSDEVGSILTTAQSMRGVADYEAFSDFGREEADELVEKARRFIEAVEEQVLRDR